MEKRHPTVKTIVSIRKDMARAKTIAFFALIGPAAAAVPFLVWFLTLAPVHRDAQGIGMAVAALLMAYVYALLMAYVYGLIPAVLCGVLFACYTRRHPPAISSPASVARVGAVAGFLSSLPLAGWTFLVTEKVLGYNHALIAVPFLVLGIFSGAVCAILWRNWASAVTKPAPARKTKNPHPQADDSESNPDSPQQ